MTGIFLLAMQILTPILTILLLLVNLETSSAFGVQFSELFRTLRVSSHLYHGSLSIQQRRILSSGGLSTAAVVCPGSILATRTRGDLTQCQSRSPKTPEIENAQKIIAQVEATKAAANGNVKFTSRPAPLATILPARSSPDRPARVGMPT